MTGDGICKDCGKKLLYGRHTNSEKCDGIAKLFTGPQEVLSQTGKTITTRPIGIEPGKLSITWPKKR